VYSTTTSNEVRPSASIVSPTAPAPAASGRISGQEAYDRVCKVCHGEDARGDTGPRLVPFSRSSDEMLAIVREGTGRMPPISARELSDEGVALVAAYLTSLTR
jgi:mono/diheme cytochrome c family protein